ncbi:hypothetical protein BV22DRAFT_25859 [Leucogyrophana mollusca]|uniref:Uncharacterized protein n=1 Tax=Leucogyrophana mollusca TaxID=85980 RepID=A0ACB8C1H6_9AGAM|nr:hypothetical protein BV22DRAFT_25859 [Leucogyrophana mollusca]
MVTHMYTRACERPEASPRWSSESKTRARFCLLPRCSLINLYGQRSCFGSELPAGALHEHSLIFFFLICLCGAAKSLQSRYEGRNAREDRDQRQ